MDKLNLQWLKGNPNFYFRYKRRLIESMIEGTCLNVGCGSHNIKDAVNIDEGLPFLPFEDESFDTVVCSDVLEHLEGHRQAIKELQRVARKKIIITVPAYPWLYGKYDLLLGHKRRYRASDFSGFDVQYIFWFLIPVLFLRKLFGLRHFSLPAPMDRFFFFLSKWHLNFGTTILATKRKVCRKDWEKHKISIFIPVFNEKKIFPRTLKTINNITKKIPTEHEIFIVNDASQDGIKMNPEALGGTGEKITFLDYEIGPTRRENLAQSFKKAQGDIIVFVDADVTISLRFLCDLIETVMSSYDIAIGSRYVKGSKIKRRPLRLLISIFYNACMRLLFKTNIHDHMCGFKAFKKDILLKLVEEMGYDKSLRRGIFWDTELLVRALRHGYRVKEIPVWWTERNESKLYFKREIKTLPYILQFIKTFR